MSERRETHDYMNRKVKEKGKSNIIGQRKRHLEIPSASWISAEHHWPLHQEEEEIVSTVLERDTKKLYWVSTYEMAVLCHLRK